MLCSAAYDPMWGHSQVFTAQFHLHYALTLNFFVYMSKDHELVGLLHVVGYGAAGVGSTEPMSQLWLSARFAVALQNALFQTPLVVNTTLKSTH